MDGCTGCRDDEPMNRQAVRGVVYKAVVLNFSEDQQNSHMSTDIVEEAAQDVGPYVIIKRLVVIDLRPWFTLAASLNFLFIKGSAVWRHWQVVAAFARQLATEVRQNAVLFQGCIAGCCCGG